MASSQVKGLKQILSARSGPDGKARAPVKEAGIGNRSLNEDPLGRDRPGGSPEGS